MPRLRTAVARTSASRSIPKVTTRPRKTRHPLRDPVVVGIGDEHGRRRGALEDLGLRVGDGIHRVKEAQMRFADVGPHPYIRFSDAHERADFAGVIHPQFDDGNLRPLPQLDERQRQPDVVIEVSAVADDAVPRRKKLPVTSFVVVLPALPVMATTFVPDARRTACASACSAAIVSSTSMTANGGRRLSAGKVPGHVRVRRPPRLLRPRSPPRRSPLRRTVRHESRRTARPMSAFACRSRRR